MKLGTYMCFEDKAHLRYCRLLYDQSTGKPHIPQLLSYTVPTKSGLTLPSGRTAAQTPLPTPEHSTSGLGTILSLPITDIT